MQTLKQLLEELDPEMSTMTVADLYEEVEQDGKTVFKFKPTIDGMKPSSDVEKLQEALRKERGDHKKAKDKYKPLGDRDPAQILEELSEIEDMREKLEASGDVSEEKINELVEKRLARVKAQSDRERAALEAERDALAESNAITTKKLDDLIIGQTLREEATKVCDPAVIADVMDIGRAALTRNDDGEIVTRDDNEFPLKEWLTQKLEERQHWNKPSGNGNAGKGNSGNQGGGKNPFSADNYDFERRRWRPGALAAQDAYRREKGAEVANAAATAAGVTRPGAAPNRPT